MQFQLFIFYKPANLRTQTICADVFPAVACQASRKYVCVRRLQTRMFTEEISRTSTIHSGIFRGQALWVDSASPRMNTIMSRDQLKPIRIGENLAVNYNEF